MFHLQRSTLTPTSTFLTPFAPIFAHSSVVTSTSSTESLSLSSDISSSAATNNILASTTSESTSTPIFSSVIAAVSDPATSAAASASSGVSSSGANAIAGASAPTEYWVAKFLPVDWAERFLLHIHELTGLPWWLSISLAALCFRASILPTALFQLRAAARVSRLTQYTQLFAKVMVFLTSNHGDVAKANPIPVAFAQASRVASQLIAPLKIRLSYLFLPMLVSIPAFMTFNVATRRLLDGNAATQSVSQSLTLEGLPWATDLTMSDPHYILPAVALGVTILNIHLAFRRFQDPAKKNDSAATSGNGNQQQAVATPLDSSMWGKVGSALQLVAVCVTPFTLSLPSGMFLYWVITMTFSVVQHLLTRTSTVRTWAGFGQPPFTLPSHTLKASVLRFAPPVMDLVPEYEGPETEAIIAATTTTTTTTTANIHTNANLTAAGGADAGAGAGAGGDVRGRTAQR